MGELGALFNPGMRHEIAERKAKASRREEEGNADPGKMRIDLLSGVVVIDMGQKSTPKAAQEDPVADDSNTSDDTAAEDPTDDNTAEATDHAGDDDRTDEAVQGEQTPAANTGSGGDSSTDTAAAPAADLGVAPQANRHTDVSVDEVDPDALQIAEQASNDEPPA